MAQVSSFPPLSGPRARVLVLGSMPGKASLAAQQYYAHPRNAFWPIIEAVLGIGRDQPYALRCRQLVARDIAVWDVLQSCYRPGSLDADIDPASIMANDFVAFFSGHPRIRRICFNGATAQQVFRRQVLPSLPADHLPDMIRLPSTSPAHAGMRLEQKITEWAPCLVVPPDA